MRTISEYFEKVQFLVKGLSHVEIERYDEQLLSLQRGNLKIRLRFVDNSLLEISEAIERKEGMFLWLSYRYHYQRADGGIIFRYDNTPHHPELSTHPDHKHTNDSVVGSGRPGLDEVLVEVKKYL